MVAEMTAAGAKIRAEGAVARKGVGTKTGAWSVVESARETRVAVEAAAAVSSTDVCTTEPASVASTKTTAMAAAEATAVTSAETAGVAATGMTSASALRPERDREDEGERRDGEQATHTNLL